MIHREGTFFRSAMGSLHHLEVLVALEVPLLCQASRHHTAPHELDTSLHREMSSLLRQCPCTDHRENNHRAEGSSRRLDNADQQRQQSQDNDGQVTRLHPQVESHRH